MLLNDLKNKKNLEAYAIIFMGLVLTFLGVFGIAELPVTASGILVILTHIVYNNINEKRTLERLLIHLESTKKKASPIRFSELPNELTRKQFSSSKEIKLLGVSLFRFLPVYYQDIEKSMAQGGSLRIILMDPNSSHTRLIGVRSPSGTPHSVQVQRINDTIDFIKRWKNKNKALDIKVVGIDYLPSFSLSILMPSDSGLSAFSYMRMFPFKTPSLNAPAIAITSDTEPDLFSYFDCQFESMWSSGTEITL